MPRTAMGKSTWLRRAEERAAEEDLMNRNTKWNIKKRMSLAGMSPEKVVLMVDSQTMKSPDTYNQKVRHSERFTMKELRRLFKLLDFSDDEILECMRTRG